MSTQYFRWLATGLLALVPAALLASEPSPPAFPKAAAPARLVSDSRLAQLERDATGGAADDVLELALAYDERKDARAADCYRRAASQGVGAAELRLGALSEKGEGGQTQSYEQARLHYERAVALGVPEANLRLGLLYLDGWGVTRDPAAAVKYIERAAEAGYLPAQKVLADMLFAGVGVPADAKRALVWAERAAVDRDPESLARIGSIHLPKLQQAAVSRPEDFKQAREWYQLSAEQDYTRGMLQMAATFLRPGADPENMRLGLRWLDLAAEGGNSAAAFHRAGFHLLGGQTEPTPEAVAAARRLLTQSAEAGEAPAQEVLELEKSRWPLWTAFRYVVTQPYENRYVQRVVQQSATLDTATTHRPVPLKMTRPIYPAAMRLTGTQGEVLVEFVVDTTGRVRDAKLVKGTHPAFSDLAVAAVINWRFRPGMVDGHAVNTRMQVPIQFQLSDIANAGQ